ncbi:hypothetical protein Q1695_001216 [Nippostrongylus brasiliensis]|nr:hypothetical protein Q1695_001216 [Nippostrongylus brasiliensis]
MVVLVLFEISCHGRNFILYMGWSSRCLSGRYRIIARTLTDSLIELLDCKTLAELVLQEPMKKSTVYYVSRPRGTFCQGIIGPSYSVNLLFNYTT